MTQHQIQQLQEQFLGKRIAFKDSKGELFIGDCQFIGYNTFIPEWGFQVTIDRLPVRHVNPSTIKLYEEKR